MARFIRGESSCPLRAPITVEGNLVLLEEMERIVQKNSVRVVLLDLYYDYLSFSF